MVTIYLLFSVTKSATSALAFYKSYGTKLAYEIVDGITGGIAREIAVTITRKMHQRNSIKLIKSTQNKTDSPCRSPDRSDISSAKRPLAVGII